jgi:hypothetical protein
MNKPKQEILEITVDLLFQKKTRPANCNITTVGGLNSCVASVLEESSGQSHFNPTGHGLRDESAKIFLEIIWDLICARVITPTHASNGLNEIHLHSDAKANLEKFRVAARI